MWALINKYNFFQVSVSVKIKNVKVMSAQERA